jgi:hypothetical protein
VAVLPKAQEKAEQQQELQAGALHQVQGQEQPVSGLLLGGKEEGQEL